MWKFVFCAALCLFTSSSFVSSQCCDFDAYICSWETGIWKTSDVYPIDTLDYPYFYSSQPSEVGPYVLFTQNMMGTTSSQTHFYVSSPETIISFDYFFALPSGVATTNNDFLAISISNVDGYFTTSLLSSSFNDPSDIWRHIYVSCDQSIAYCCGGADKIPCYITITFTASLDYTYPQGLFAVDNIGTSWVAAPTNTIEPTPPTPTFCCNFNSNPCSFDLSGGWYWSATSPPPSIPYSDGEYIWTSTNNTVAYIANQNEVTPTTSFSIDYFVSSSSVYLEVSFVSTSPPTGPVVLAYLYYYSSTWAPAAIKCTTCCGGYASCDGQLQVRLVGTSGYVGAIDNAARDEICGGDTYPCCQFEDPTLCGFYSSSMNGLTWSSSAVSTSNSSIPSPGSNFIYFEAADPPTPLSLFLYSPFVYIKNNAEFEATVFVNVVPYSANNLLQFVFQTTDGVVHPLISIRMSCSFVPTAAKDTQHALDKLLQKLL